METTWPVRGWNDFPASASVSARLAGEFADDDGDAEARPPATDPHPAIVSREATHNTPVTLAIQTERRAATRVTVRRAGRRGTRGRDTRGRGTPRPYDLSVVSSAIASESCAGVVRALMSARATPRGGRSYAAWSFVSRTTGGPPAAASRSASTLPPPPGSRASTQTTRGRSASNANSAAASPPPTVTRYPSMRSLRAY